MEWPALIFIGLIAGTFGSLVGLGGGVIIVPALLFINSLGILSIPIEHHNATGISLMVLIFTASSSVIYYFKQNRVDYKSGLYFFLASGPASILGSLIGKYIELEIFYILFGFVMILMTLLLAQQNRVKPIKIKWDVERNYIDKDGIIHTYGYNKKLGFIIAFFAGLLAGLFGMGGGAIFVPMMVILFRFPIHVATATSMFIILLSSTTGSITHIFQGHVIFSYVLIIGIGAFIGGRLGAYVSSKMNSKNLILVLRIVIIIIAIKMIHNGVTL